MTTHYKVEMIKPKVFLKITYVLGRLKRIERDKGVLNRKVLDTIGQAIPLKETDIPKFNEKWLNRVNYSIISKNQKEPPTLLKKCEAVWFDFYKSNHKQISPKHQGAEVNALKGIIKHFKSQFDDEDEVLASWQMILDNWDSLGDFHKKQVDLKYINSKLNVIIRELQSKNTTTTDSFTEAVESETARGFSFG